MVNRRNKNVPFILNILYLCWGNHNDGVLIPNDTSHSFSVCPLKISELRV